MRMCSFLLPRIADMRREGVVERLEVGILSVRRKKRLHGSREIAVETIRHPKNLPTDRSAAATYDGGRPRRGMTSTRLETQVFLIAIFFSLVCARGVFGSVTVSTPFWKCASILSASTPSGTPNDRWNAP